jgi:tRNA A37 methylthiotransferase MiaB
MRDFLFIQCSTNLINKDNKKDVADSFYSGIYELKAKDGYFNGADFWEVPLWIAEISGSFKDYSKELYILHDVKEAARELEHKEIKHILLSVLEVNKAYYLELIKEYKGAATFLIGGYVDFTEFKQFNNVKIFSSIKALAESFNIVYEHKTDYALFKGLKIIPRLNLSTGCLNRCKFCTIEKELKEFSLLDVINQAMSFKDLNFKLIYINDKTFGQAKNYNFLKYAYNVIKKYNADFKGFIIQTTASQALKPGFIAELKALNVVIVELGLESFNNEILKGLRKPHSPQQVQKAVNLLHEAGLKVILNIIIGLIGENNLTYGNTLNYIKENITKIYSLNIYNLAIYKETELGLEIGSKNANDLNELKTEKSFYNQEAVLSNKYFYDKIFNLGLEILRRG